MIWPKLRGVEHYAYAMQSMTKGQFVYIAGSVVAGDNPLATPGYSSTGDRKVKLANPPATFGLQSFLMNGGSYPTTSPLVSGAKAAPSMVYPVDKLIYKPEDAETSLQTISSGQGVIYYQGGEYETDQWEDATSVMANAVYGDLLFLNGNSKITRDVGWQISGFAVGFFVSLAAAADTGSGVILPSWGNFLPSTRMLWYRLINQQ